MEILKFFTGFVLLLFLSIASIDPAIAAQACSISSDIERDCRSTIDPQPFNRIQTIGSHNSYKLAIPRPELELIRKYREASAITLDYSHLSLVEQLDSGMRQIELDIVYDPQGGRYADPMLARQTKGLEGAAAYDNSRMHAPGFKVLHAQDLDVRSSCATWILCLTEIKNWSADNPAHVPILIMFNAKTGKSAYPGSLAALPFDAAAFDALDAEILSVFSEDELLSPDDVRGNFTTLRQAVLEKGWPSLENSRGLVFFALDEGEEKVNIYSRGNPSLQGLPVFVNSVNEQADHAAYFTINNPILDMQRIQEAVRKGFIVRTRADANTYEARQNDTERRDAAFASGAQYISTDYYLPRLEFSEYRVSFNSGAVARCNPALLSANCTPP